jgi:phosphoglycolate phosphatase
MLNLSDKINTIIFDLDGTLVDSAPGVISCLSSVFSKNNITPKRELNTGSIGPPLADIIRSSSDIEDDTQLEKIVNDFKRCYDSEGYKNTNVFPGVHEMLLDLSNNNFTLYIATNKRDKPTKLMIDYFSWGDFFSEIYSVDMNDSLFSSKSDMVLQVLHNNKLKPENVVYVGDTVDDKKSARNAGVGFIYAYWGYAK